MIDYNKVSDNYEVIELIKQRQEIERQIMALDKDALFKYEMELISMPDHVFNKLKGVYR